ncbi:MAG: hypothetical protein ABI136_06000 [Ginsengibacter sp.]
MSASKHSVIKSRMLAIIFLFLNVVCIASPVMKNTADDYNQLISLPFGHDANSAESEENQLPNSSFINYNSQRFILAKNDHCPTNFICNVPSPAGQKSNNSYFIPFDLLPKPGYYSFLFLYTLF